jgi:hypothetical protein
MKEGKKKKKNGFTAEKIDINTRKIRALAVIDNINSLDPKKSESWGLERNKHCSMSKIKGSKDRVNMCET